MVDAAPTIHQAIAAVLADLPAIGKNQRNQQQGFSFRGIDDVLDALNPLLAKHGVFFVPTVLERLESDRQTRNGGTLWVVDLHVRYTFYGPAGDFVEASAWGEGTDSGDKATQKAMTGAMKYVLFQVFAIATHEQADADADLTSHRSRARAGSAARTQRGPNPQGKSEPGVNTTPVADSSAGSAGGALSSPPAPGASPAVSKLRRDNLKARCVALTADGVSVADAREELKLPLVDSCDEEEIARFEALVSDLEAALEAPFAEAKS